MKTRWGAFIAAVTLIVAVAALPSRASSTEGAPLVSPEAGALSGQSVFTTRTTSKWLVRLPRDVAVSDVSTGFSGNGRVIGFFLAEANKPLNKGLILHGNGIGQCKKKGCVARGARFRFTYRSSLADTLYAGLYDVYVIADAAPVTLEIHVEGLSGTTRLRGGSPVPAVIKTLTHRVVEQDQGSVYSAGHFLPDGAPQTEFGLVGIWAGGTNHVGAGFGDCYYYPGDLNRPPSEEMAFLPGCPTGDGFEHKFVSERPLENGGFVYVSGNRGGPDGAGGWFSSAGVPKRYGAVAAWVDLTE